MCRGCRDVRKRSEVPTQTDAIVEERAAEEVASGPTEVPAVGPDRLPKGRSLPKKRNDGFRKVDYPQNGKPAPAKAPGDS